MISGKKLEQKLNAMSDEEYAQWRLQQLLRIKWCCLMSGALSLVAFCLALYAEFKAG